MTNAWAGGPDFQEQQIACPSCPECSRTKEFYGQLREYKELPLKDKVDMSFQITGILWGYTWLVVVPLVVGAFFWREVLTFFKNKRISISFSKRDKDA